MRFNIPKKREFSFVKKIMKLFNYLIFKISIKSTLKAIEKHLEKTRLKKVSQVQKTHAHFLFKVS